MELFRILTVKKKKNQQKKNSTKNDEIFFFLSFSKTNRNSMQGGFSRFGVPESTPCEARSCLWIEGVMSHISHQREEILEHLNDY